MYNKYRKHMCTCYLSGGYNIIFYFQGKYIAECIDEIKQELRQENQAVKANAVNKLLYVRKCKPYQKNVKCETNMNM